MGVQRWYLAAFQVLINEEREPSSRLLRRGFEGECVVMSVAVTGICSRIVPMLTQSE